jgi:hypothetical protein
MALAPLVAEAKQRMRRRRSLVALGIALVGLALGLSFALRSPSAGSGIPRPLTSSLRTGQLRVSVPRGFYSYPFRGGIYKAGTRPPVIGHLLTNLPLPAHVDAWKAFDRWAAYGGSGPPANRVALVLVIRGMGPVGPKALHVPLTLRQSLWANEQLKSGAVGYRYGDLRFHNGDYDVEYWSGPRAPAEDRSAILRTLKSIRPAAR